MISSDKGESRKTFLEVKIMNWNKDKSLMLTRWCIRGFTVLLFAGCAAAPWIFRIFLEIRAPRLEGKFYYFLATAYTVAIPVAIALYQMNGLLSNISRNEVFILKNTTYLRGLSWCCMTAGIIFLLSSLYYAPFLALSGAAVFMALVLRVIKNVFVQASEIKEENDYTI